MPVAHAVLSERSVAEVLRTAARMGRALVERQSTISFRYKSDGSILSELDEEIQREIHSCVRALHDPEAAEAHFVGEEEDAGSDATQTLARGRFNWVVDALDGTAAYTRGLNTYAISIALLDDEDRPQLALIHLPGMFGRSHIASAHEGELKRYELSDEGDLRAALPAGPLPAPASWRGAADKPLRRSYLYANSNMHRLGLEGFRGKIRNLGSTAAHLAMLCEGVDDPAAVLLTRSKTWDVAAGLALAEASGLEIREKGSWRRLRFREALESYRLGADQGPPQLVGHPVVLEGLRSALSR